VISPGHSVEFNGNQDYMDFLVAVNVQCERAVRHLILIKGGGQGPRFIWSTCSRTYLLLGLSLDRRVGRLDGALLLAGALTVATLPLVLQGAFPALPARRK
jgi:hypothetical protein